MPVGNAASGRRESVEAQSTHIPPGGGGGGSGKNKQVDGEAGETVRLREEIAERASGSQTCEKNIEGGRRGEDATGQWLRRIGTPPVLSK